MENLTFIEFKTHGKRDFYIDWTVHPHKLDSLRHGFNITSFCSKFHYPHRNWDEEVSHSDEFLEMLVTDFNRKYSVFTFNLNHKV